MLGAAVSPGVEMKALFGPLKAAKDEEHHGGGTLSLEDTPKRAQDSQTTTKWSHLHLQKSRESSGEASGCVSSREQRSLPGGHWGGR